MRRAGVSGPRLFPRRCREGASPPQRTRGLHPGREHHAEACWLKRHLPKEGSVTLRDVISSYAMINVCGPSSREPLQRLSENDFSNGTFPFGQCRQAVVGYAPVLALRGTYIGELGYELYMPPKYAAGIYENLWTAGQDLGTRNAGYRTIDSLRLEKGYCYWGAEVSPDYRPFDAGIGFAVSLSKGPFIGRDALMRIKQNGPAWKLCLFILDSDRPMLLHDGKTCNFKSRSRLTIY